MRYLQYGINTIVPKHRELEFQEQVPQEKLLISGCLPNFFLTSLILIFLLFTISFILFYIIIYPRVLPPSLYPWTIEVWYYCWSLQNQNFSFVINVKNAMIPSHFTNEFKIKCYNAVTAYLCTRILVHILHFSPPSTRLFVNGLSFFKLWLLIGNKRQKTPPFKKKLYLIHTREKQVRLAVIYRIYIHRLNLEVFWI